MNLKGVRFLNYGVKIRIDLIPLTLLSLAINASANFFPDFVNTPLLQAELYLKPLYPRVDTFALGSFALDTSALDTSALDTSALDTSALDTSALNNAPIMIMPLRRTSADYEMAKLSIDRVEELYPLLGKMLRQAPWQKNNQKLIRILSYLIRNRDVAGMLEQQLSEPHAQIITADFMIWLSVTSVTPMRKLQALINNPTYLVRLLVAIYNTGNIGMAITMLPVEQIIEIMENSQLINGMQAIDEAIQPGVQGWVATLLKISQQLDQQTPQLPPNNPHLLMSTLVVLSQGHYGSFGQPQVQQFPHIHAAINDVDWTSSYPAFNQQGVNRGSLAFTDPSSIIARDISSPTRIRYSAHGYHVHYGNHGAVDTPSASSGTNSFSDSGYAP